MARETKVGLLAGLAFIICFAIILANRSEQGRIAQQMPSFVKQTSLQNPSGRRSTNNRATNGLPVNGRLNQAQGVRPASSQRSVHNGQGYTGKGQNNGSRNHVPANRGRDNNPRVLQSTNAGSETAPDSTPQFSNNRQNPGAPGNNNGTAPVSDGRLEYVQQVYVAQPAQPQQQRNSSSAGGFVPSVSAKDRAAFVAATSARVKAPAHKKARQTYRVRSGDTLTRIAQQHYGSRSVKLVKALFDANSSVMSSPDHLIIGKELVLPKVVAGFASFNKVSAKHISPSAKKTTWTSSKPRNDPPTRWYQIKENDRYETIASRELKDAKRWREIHELNKKVFPDPNRIQSGVRIRLPVLKVADARERRH